MEYEWYGNLASIHGACCHVGNIFAELMKAGPNVSTNERGRSLWTLNIYHNDRMKIGYECLATVFILASSAAEARSESELIMGWAAAKDMTYDDYEIDEMPCPKCGHSFTHSRPCDTCGGEGLREYLDAPEEWGEDCPMEENHLLMCGQCAGVGIDRWCPECGAGVRTEAD